MNAYFLTIDLGTTNVKLLTWNTTGEIIERNQFPVTLTYPLPGGVEFDPNALLSTLKEKLTQLKYRPRGIGITNQRETTIVWDESGKLVYPAIVWQDRRTARWCTENRDKTEFLYRKTGLMLDPYFSLSKLVWILNNVSCKKPVYFGTLDTYVLWKLTGGKSYYTEYTNASRTMMFNIYTLEWDQDIIREFSLQDVIFPAVVPSTYHFGEFPLGAHAYSPVQAVLGDQQASFLGQGCFTPGVMKNTYGTGCFLMANCGRAYPKQSRKLLTTLASFEDDRKPVYALEGCAFSAGVLMEWLQTLGFYQDPHETEKLAREAKKFDDLLLIPAFWGLGVPYWDPYARGALFGLTPNVGKKEIVYAALEAVALESTDIMKSMEQVVPETKEMTVDGGMSRNQYLMQLQADLSGKAIRVFPEVEATSLGVFYLMAASHGLLKRDFIEAKRQKGTVFTPAVAEEERKRHLEKWQRGIERVRGWSSHEKTL